MLRLPLRILRGLHPPSASLGHPVEAIRLITHISLRSHTGWTPFRDIVVDTGAPISLLPSSVWSVTWLIPFGATEVGGIATRPECRIPALLAEVDCILSDGAVTLGPLRVPAYLAQTDATPTLLGISGFIARGTLHVQIEQADAYIELAAGQVPMSTGSQ